MNVPGAGKDHHWIVTIDGQISERSTTNYGKPEIVSFSGPGAFDALTDGGELIRIHGRNFGPAGSEYLEGVQYAYGTYTAADCIVVGNGHDTIECATSAGVGENLRRRCCRRLSHHEIIESGGTGGTFADGEAIGGRDQRVVNANDGDGDDPGAGVQVVGAAGIFYGVEDVCRVEEIPIIICSNLQICTITRQIERMRYIPSIVGVTPQAASEHSRRGTGRTTGPNGTFSYTRVRAEKGKPFASKSFVNDGDCNWRPLKAFTSSVLRRTEKGSLTWSPSISLWIRPH